MKKLLLTIVLGIGLIFTAMPGQTDPSDNMKGGDDLLSEAVSSLADDASRADACPDCSGTDPIQGPFPVQKCDCVSPNPLTVGPDVTVPSGAEVHFKAPQIIVKAGSFFEPGSIVTFLPGILPPASLTITSSPNRIPADGVQQSEITITVKDAGENMVVDGMPVIISTNAGSLGTAKGGTVSGVLQTTLTSSSRAETATITAKSGDISNSAGIVFGGTVADIELTADPEAIPGDNTSYSVIKTVLTQDDGNPVPKGTKIIFETDLGRFSDNEQTYSLKTQDATGTVAAFLFSGITLGTATVVATSEGVTAQVTVEIVSSPPGSLTLEANPKELAADGEKESKLTAMAKNTDGSVAADGVKIFFEIVSGPGMLSSDSAETRNGGGTADVNLTSRTEGETVVAARAEQGSVTDQTTVRFIRKIKTISLHADTTSVKTDGSDTATVTATVLDVNNVPVEGITVTFYLETGDGYSTDGQLSVSTLDTDANGQAKVLFSSGLGNNANRMVLVGASITSKSAESIPIQITGTTLVMEGNGTSLEINNPDYPAKARKTLSVTVKDAGGSGVYNAEIQLFSKSESTGAVSLSIPADGAGEIEVQAAVLDADGNPVPQGTQATFTTTLGVFNESSRADTFQTETDDAGMALATLKSSMASGNATVTVVTNHVAGSIPVVFTGTVETGFVTLIAASKEITTGETSVITAHLKDAEEEPVPQGTQVIFTTTLGVFNESSADIFQTETNDSGKATATLKGGATTGTAVVVAGTGNVSGAVGVDVTDGNALGTVTLRADSSKEYNTDVDGQLQVVVTGVRAGDVWLDAASLGATSTRKYEVGERDEVFSIIMPTKDPYDAQLLTRAVTEPIGGIVFDCDTNTITQADSGNFLTDGFRVGDKIMVTGSTANDNDYSYYTISKVTDKKITLDATDTLVSVLEPEDSQVVISAVNVDVQASTPVDDQDDQTTFVAPKLTFAAPNLINREEGSFDEENFSDGGRIQIKGASDTNNGSYQIATVQSKRLTLLVSDEKKIEDQSAAPDAVITQLEIRPAIRTVSITKPAVGVKLQFIAGDPDDPDDPDDPSYPPEIRKTGGDSFFEEGYVVGDTIMVGGTTANDGVYTISQIIDPQIDPADPDTLKLSLTDTLLDEGPLEDKATVTNGVLVGATTSDPKEDRVVFASTFGLWDGGSLMAVEKKAGKIGGYRKAFAVLCIYEPGSATVEAYEKSSPQSKDTLMVLASAPETEASKITLQASPTVVAPLEGDAAAENRSSLRAAVTNSTGQVVGGAPVVFSIENPTGGGESVSPVLVYTNNLGQAQATFTAGTLSTNAEGVTLRGTILGAPEISPGEVKVIIGGTAGSIVIGHGSTVESINNDTAYRLPMSVLVVDSNGNAVSGANVTLGAWPLNYAKGEWEHVGEALCILSRQAVYTNEDINRNLTLDNYNSDLCGKVENGEDRNGDCELTPSSSASGSVPGTVKTDASGLATFDLIYLKGNAAWINAEISASTFVLGTETRSAQVFWLPHAIQEGLECILPNSPYNDARPPSKIVLAANPGVMIPDGSSESAVRAVVTDINGKAVSNGTEVSFQITGGAAGGGLPHSSSSTQYTQKGVATATYMASETPGKVEITASTSNDVAATVEIILDVGSIELTAAPDKLLADGSSESTITAMVTDGKGDPVPAGQRINFILEGAGGLPYSSSDWDYTVGGLATVTYRAGNTPSQIKITASSPSGAIGSVTIELTRGSVTLTATPEKIVADGRSESTVTAIVADADGSPAPDNQRISFTIAQGGGGLPYSSTRSAYTVAGAATVTYRSADAPGVVKISASEPGGGIGTAEITLFEEVGGIDIVAAPNELPADGSSESNITASVTNGIGQPAADGLRVNFAIIKGSGGLPYRATDYAYTSGGVATATYRASQMAEEVDIQAFAGTGLIKDTATITLARGIVGFIALSPLPSEIPADGINSLAIRATVTDASGNPVTQGTEIEFVTTLGTFSNGKKKITAATRDTTGIVMVSLISSVMPGIASVVASSGDIFQSCTASFIGTYQMGRLTLIADPMDIPANEAGTSQITAVLKNANGDSVDEGTEVVFTTTIGTFVGSNTNEYTTATGDGGVASAELEPGAEAGIAAVVAVWEDTSHGVDIEFTMAPPTAYLSLTAEPLSVPADGESLSAVTVVLYDQDGNPVPKGTEVTFTTTLGTFSNGISTHTTTTGGASAAVSVLLKSPDQGVAVVTVSSDNASKSVAVAFSATAPGSIVLVSDKTSMPAGDDQSISLITASAKDSSGNPAPIGTKVRFTTTLGEFTENSSQTYTVQTPGDGGIATATLKASTQSGTATVSGTWDSDTVSEAIEVIFTPTTASSMVLGADPENIAANGDDYSYIIAAVKNATGEPVPEGTEVVFTTTHGHFDPSDGEDNETTWTTQTSGADGTVTAFLVASTDQAAVTVIATSGEASQSTALTFTGNSPLGAMTLAADPGAVLADDVATSHIVGMVKNASGNPEYEEDPEEPKGTEVIFTTTLGEFDPSDVGDPKTYTTRTDAGGWVSATLKAGNTPGTATVHAVCGMVSNAVAVAFMPTAAHTIDLTADSQNIPAVTGTSNITAALKDVNGNPVAAEEATFITTLGELDPSNVGNPKTYTTITDAAGMVSASLNSDDEGIATVTVISSNTSHSIPITIVAAIQGAMSITADTATIPADGTSTAYIAATLKDSNGNPVAAAEVKFITTVGEFDPYNVGGDPKTYTAITDTDGVASATLKSTNTAGTATVTATSEKISQSTTVSFSGNTPGTMTLRAYPTTISADGVSSLSLSVELRDACAHPLSKGSEITFKSTFGTFENSQQNYTVKTVDDTGEVTVELFSSTSAGVSTITATCGEVSRAVSTIFKGASTAVSLSLSAEKTGIKSDNSETAAITASVLDGNNAALEGVLVTFSTNGGQIGAATATTGSTGEATITFSSGTTDRSNRVATITASVSGLADKTIPIEIEGSTLTCEADKTNITNDEESNPATLTITAKDAGGGAVYEAPITLSSEGDGEVTVEPLSGKTDVSGQLTAEVKGVKDGETGSVIVTADWAGTKFTQAFTVTDADDAFEIVLPEKNPFSARSQNVLSVAITGDNDLITFTDAAPPVIERTDGGDWRVDGYAVDDKIMVGGSAGDDGVYTIDAVSDSTLTLVDTDTLVNEAAGASVTITNGVLVRVKVIANTDIVFSSTFGIWDKEGSSTKTKHTGSDHTWAVLSANNNGTATVQVYYEDDPAVTDKTSVVFSAPSDEAARIILQTNKSVLAPSTGGNVNSATLTATVRTSDGQVVGDAPVAFTIENPTGGGETVSPGIVVTNSSGSAETIFTSGSLSSGAEGVIITARVLGAGETVSNTGIAFIANRIITRSDGGSFVTDGFKPGQEIRVQGSGSNDGYYTISAVAESGANITLETSDSLSNEAQGESVTITAVETKVNVVIGGSAGSVVLGRGTEFNEDPNVATYSLPMVVLVADSNGNPVTNAVVTLSTWPTQYSSGVWYDTDIEPDAEEFKPYGSGVFGNEDANENLILDPGEDTNGDGLLTPPSSSAGTVPATVTTDGTGIAAFNLIYLKSSAFWIEVRIKAGVLAQGSESTSFLTFWLPYKKEEGESGVLPNSGYPVGLTTNTTSSATYTFRAFRGSGDAFTTGGTLTRGTSAMGDVVNNYDYTYTPDAGTAAEVGDEVWDYVSVVNGGMSANFPVRIIIK